MVDVIEIEIDMKMPYIFCAKDRFMWLLLVSFSAVILAVLSQTPPPLTTPPWRPPTDGWDVGTDAFPNPQTDYARCQQRDSSWLCDPNRMLSNDQTEEIQAALVELHGVDDANCKNCDSNCAPVGVAVVNNVKYLSEDEIESKNIEYSEKIFNSWNQINSQCSASALIFVSWNQQMIVVADRNVNETVCESIINKTKEECQYTESDHSIVELLHIYRRMLTNQKSCEKDDDDDNSESGTSYTVIIIIIVIVLVIIGIIVVVLIVRYKKRQNLGHSDPKERASLPT